MDDNVTLFDRLTYAYVTVIVIAIIAGVVVLVLMIPSMFIVQAQDTPTCDYTTLQPLLRIADEQISEGNPDIITDTLDELAADLRAIHAACAGLMFSSEIDGAQPVLPITLDAGTWIARAETDGAFFTSTTLTDGDCNLSYGTIGTIYPGVGEVNTVIVSEGCTFLLEITATADPWSLTFERVG